jgi:hypothetical protein
MTLPSGVILNGVLADPGNDLTGRMPDPPVSAATRYLSAGAHLRRGMLPDTIAEAGLAVPRAPLPVGRKYALLYLRGAGRPVPMVGVHVPTVEHHCRVAIRQTMIRDVLAAGVIIAVAVMQPWGTAITAVLLAGAMILAGRTRFPLGVAVVIVFGVLALAAIPKRGIPDEALAPLLGLVTCFAIYAGDMLLSAIRIRRLWRNPPSAPPDSGHPDVVFFGPKSLVGAGTPVDVFRLTVPVGKPLVDTRPIASITAGHLLEYLRAHLVAQGVADKEPYGYARDVAGDVRGRGAGNHFTYGVPYLDVRRVVGVPLPAERKLPFIPVSFRQLRYHNHPAATTMDTAVNQSPSRFPNRHYLRASSVSWDGQLVVSVFVSAAMQGHYLQVLIRPYVIAPIGADLKSADALVNRHAAALWASALGLAARQFVRVAKRVGRVGAAKSTADKAGLRRRQGVRSVRELYALPTTDSMHQTEDASRIVTILEEKVIRVTMSYLRECNVDVAETEALIMNMFVQNTVMGDGSIITGGTFTNTQVTTVAGQGNTATSTSR